MPNACIGADVIVGFPGESDDDFWRPINSYPIWIYHIFMFFLILKGQY